MGGHRGFLCDRERVSAAAGLPGRRQIVELVADRARLRGADPVALAEIADFARRIEQASDVEDLRPLDRAFHAVIAAAAGNALLAELHAKVLDVVFAAPPLEAMLGTAANRADAKRILGTSARTHTAIADAIMAGDVAAASAAARAHLDDVEARMIQPPHKAAG